MASAATTLTAPDFIAPYLDTIAGSPDPNAQTTRDHVSGNLGEGDTVGDYPAKAGQSGVMGGATGIWAAVRLNPGIRIIVCIEGSNLQGTFTPIGIFTATAGVTQDKYFLYTPSTQGSIAHHDVTEPTRSAGSNKRKAR